MGVDVVVGGAGAVSPEAVFALVHEWDRIFSRFRDDSEINRVNASTDGAVLVSSTFARVVRTALHAARATDGLVDPTVGEALVAAGYDRDFALLRPDPTPPGSPVPGRWRDVALTRRILVRPPGTLIDLNGVVKGLVVDEALRLLPPGSFVAVGGDVGTNGEVIVSLPRAGAVRLGAGGLATSGTSRRHWRRAGAEQHHLIDPRTGRPSQSCWDDVSVGASSCVAADVAAKAAFLLSDDGPAWLDERGLPGRFVSRGTIIVNESWSRALSASPVAA